MRQWECERPYFCSGGHGDHWKGNAREGERRSGDKACKAGGESQICRGGDEQHAEAGVGKAEEGITANEHGGRSSKRHAQRPISDVKNARTEQKIPEEIRG